MACVPETPTEPLYPHAETVESILGIPLLLDTVGPSEIPEGRQDIREAAYSLVIQAIAHHTGKDLEATDEPVALPPHERQTLTQLDDVDFLAQELAIAHAIRKNSQHIELPVHADNAETKRAQFQASVLGKVATHYMTFPAGLSYDPDRRLRKHINDSMAVVAPTGSGKTVIEALFLKLTGVGQQDSIKPKNDRSLVVVPSQKLVEQFVGDSGKNTFRSFLGEHVEVTPVYEKKKADHGDTVVTTTASVHKLNTGNYSRLIVDEGHRGLAPQMLSFLGKVGMRTLLATATAAYNEKRDLRKFFSSVEVGSLRKFIEDGILNPTRIMTYMYDDDPAMLAATIANTYIQNGRRVAVYCRRGNGSAQARNIAALINKLNGGDDPVAASVGVHNEQSVEDEDKLERGELRALTTCQRLREGYDGPFDVGIFIGPNSSALELEQKLGRIVRPGDFISEGIELLPRQRGRVDSVSLWQILGLEEIDPEMIIGPNTAISSGEGSNGGESKGGSHNTTQPAQPLPLDLLPQDALENIILKQPLRSVLLDGQPVQTAPVGHQNIDVLAARYNVPVRWLQEKLNEEGFGYVNVRHGWDRVSGDPAYVRWYDKDACAWLEENSIPQIAEATAMNRKSIARMAGISTDYLETVIKRLGLHPPTSLAHGNHMETKYYSFQDVLSILLDIELNTPIADPTDVTIAMLTEECGRTFIFGYLKNNDDVVATNKRRNPIHGLKGICLHLSQDDAEKIREARRMYDQIPLLQESDKDRYLSIRGAAEQADLAYITFEKNMTEAEKARGFLMRQKIGVPGKFFRKEDIEPIIERLKQKPLPPHLVPPEIIRKRLAKITHPQIESWFKEYGENWHKLRFGNNQRFALCLTWQQLERIEMRFDVSSNTPVIDFSRVVRDEYDDDPERRAYSQAIQKQFIDADLLDTAPPKPRPKTPPIIPPKEIAKKEQTAKETTPAQATTPPASTDEPAEAAAGEQSAIEPAATMAYEERRALVAASRGVKRGAAKPQAPLPRNIRRVERSNMPKEYVNIDTYLKSQNATCAPSVLQQLIRREQLTVAADEDGALWGPDVTALKLEEVITTRYPIAEANMSTPSKIAKRFEYLGVTPRHVAHVASRVVGSLDGHVSLRRELDEEGNPGKLDYHYNNRLTELVTSRIEHLQGQGLRMLLRFGPV